MLLLVFFLRNSEFNELLHPSLLVHPVYLHPAKRTHKRTRFNILQYVTHIPLHPPQTLICGPGGLAGSAHFLWSGTNLGHVFSSNSSPAEGVNTLSRAHIKFHGNKDSERGEGGLRTRSHNEPSVQPWHCKANVIKLCSFSPAWQVNPLPFDFAVHH